MINDSKNKLEIWGEFIDNLTSYTHPTYLFADHHEKKVVFDVIILDRMFGSLDVFNSDTVDGIRNIYPAVKIFLCSALHAKGESVPGFDGVLDQWPISKESLLEEMDQVIFAV